MTFFWKSIMPGSLETFGERCLKLIRILIPYTQGYFLVIDEDGRLDVEHSVFENVESVMKRKYLDTYFAKDYLMQMCNFTKSMAYRDTDLLTDEKRRASVIYREYFKPQKLDMGCGLIIMKEGKTRVFLNLLRKCGESDVTGHEMEILQTFLPHFEKKCFCLCKPLCFGCGKYHKKQGVRSFFREGTGNRAACKKRIFQSGNRQTASDQ